MYSAVVDQPLYCVGAASGRKSPFGCGSSPKMLRWNVTKSPRKSPFARKFSSRKASPPRKSPFACKSSPRGSRWAVTQSPYKSLFSRGPSPRKSPFAVKSMECHSPANYGGYDDPDNIFRQQNSKYYPDLDKTPNSPCFWGYKNTIWGDSCQRKPFQINDCKDPNIRFINLNK